MAADVFAIVSLAMPDWIITDVGGNIEYLRTQPCTGNLFHLPCVLYNLLSRPTDAQHIY